ncbi:Cysteine-rich secreted protein (fragment) [Candidatus Sulfopaludibacter sp. SbA3]
MRVAAFWFLLVLAAASGYDGSSPVAREMLSAHNSVRGRVDVAPLAWSAGMAARSQEWADTLLARNELVHRPNSTYGENLFEIRGATASAAHVVNSWAAEARNYDYRSNRCRGVCGHYTQIVWGSTREVGCAVARGPGREVWVCDYNPAGNWMGRRPY